MLQTRLDQYDNSWYNPGSNGFVRLLWYYTNVLIFNHGLFPFSGLKVAALRLFGAKIGKGVVIKPSVNIKYPWNLRVGDYSWIGEEVWIDNLGLIDIGSNCCISQGALLLCGNHNYKKETFDLIVKPIVLENGAWVGAKSVVSPNVTMGSNSVLTAGSVATGVLESKWIYQGNPAVKLRPRIFENQSLNG